MDPSETSEALEPLLQHPLQHVIVGHYQYEGGGTLELPALQGDHLSVTLSGANFMERRLDGRCSQGTICPSDITLVPRGAASTWRPHKGTSSVLHLFILPELWQSIARALDLDPLRVELRDDFATPDALVEQIGRALLSETQSAWVGSQLYVQTLEQALGMHLLRHYGARPCQEPSARAGNFKQALDYIEAHLAEDLSLETLATCENLSRYHFARSFKESMGQSPHQYIIGRRVKRAQHLLRTTPLPLNQIAMEVGFANQSHLNRHFRRIVGVTPKQYRQ